MDRNEFRSAASEVLTQTGEAEPEPTRPQNLYTASELQGYNQADMVSQNMAALETNERINATFFEHSAQAKQERQEQRQEVGDAEKISEQVNEHKIDQNANQEAKQPSAAENEQSPQQEFDWNRYTQDRGYAKSVDELLSKQQQQSQQNINSRQR